jgi:hypothetical protein
VTSSILPLQIVPHLNTNSLRVWSLYFTDQTLSSSLQFVFSPLQNVQHPHVMSTKLLSQFFSKDLFHLIFNFFGRYQQSGPFWKVSYHWRTDDERWYWQIHFGSNYEEKRKQQANILINCSLILTSSKSSSVWSDNVFIIFDERVNRESTFL